MPDAQYANISREALDPRLSRRAVGCRSAMSADCASLAAAAADRALTCSVPTLARETDALRLDKRLHLPRWQLIVKCVLQSASGSVARRMASAGSGMHERRQPAG